MKGLLSHFSRSILVKAFSLNDTTRLPVPTVLAKKIVTSLLKGPYLGVSTALREVPIKLFICSN